MSHVYTIVGCVSCAYRNLSAALTDPRAFIGAGDDHGIWHWDRIHAMENPVGYLYRVAQTASRRHRRWRRTPRFPAEPLVVGPAAAADDRLDLGHALARVPETPRLCIVLVHVYGWLYADVAQLLGTTTGSARLRRYRPTLDAAIEHAHAANPRDRHSRSRSNVVLLGMSASVIACIAGLAALTMVGDDSPSAGSNESVVTASLPATDPSSSGGGEGSVPGGSLPVGPVSIEACRVPDPSVAGTAEMLGTMPPGEVVTVDVATADPGLCYSTFPGVPFVAQAPHYVLADESFVPVEVNFIEGDANSTERGVVIMYLRHSGDEIQERMLCVRTTLRTSCTPVLRSAGYPRR